MQSAKFAPGDEEEDVTLISEQIRSRATGRPDDVALLREDSRGGILTCSYAELSAMTAQISGSLAAIPQTGQFVLLAPATFVSVAAIIALTDLDQPFILLPPTLSTRELSTVLRRSGSRRLLRADQPLTLIEGEVVQQNVVPGLILSTVFTSDDDTHESPLLTGSHLIQMTSGSLGESRLAVRSMSGVVDEIQSIGGCLDFQVGSDRVLCASAIAHSYGCIGGVLAPLYFGLSVVLARDQETACTLLPLTQASIVVGLASTYATLLAKPIDRKSLQSARVLLSAGAPLPGKLFETFMDHTGLPIQQDYGTTETGTISIDHGLPPSPGTVGRPLPHVEVLIRPPVDEPLEGSEAGEILVRSSAVATHYAVNGRLVQALDTDGWYHTGDMGTWASDGRLCLGRRLRPLIHLSTGTIRPEVLEAELAQLSGVLDVAVLQQELPRGRLVLKAVVATTSLSPEEIRSWCLSRLSPGHVPEIIDVVRELPRSPAGKVLHKYMIEPIG